MGAGGQSRKQRDHIYKQKYEAERTGGGARL